MVPWHPGRHASATSPSLLLTTKIRATIAWQYSGSAQGAEHHCTVIPGDTRMSFPRVKVPRLKKCPKLKHSRQSKAPSVLLTGLSVPLAIHCHYRPIFSVQLPVEGLGLCQGSRVSLWIWDPSSPIFWRVLISISFWIGEDLAARFQRRTNVQQLTCKKFFFHSRLFSFILFYSPLFSLS